MLFNSLEFAIFLPLVFSFYWLIGPDKKNSKNAFLVVSSYFFYGWWDWRFLFLIALSSLIDFYMGKKINEAVLKKKRRYYLAISLFFNIGILVYVKYCNFFIESFAQAFSLLGQQIDPGRLDLVLPVGISFYTFQTLSYTLDIYKRKAKPTNDILAFFAFVSFFPQLVAGPIERAKNLLPQFEGAKKFKATLAMDGTRQILWGLFKKIVIADNCAVYVDEIFANYGDYSGSSLLLGAFLFTFQIYGDFSGYSDIAIGTGRLFGVNLSQNFAFPYFSRDLAEFWRRWHISLTSWFKDYIYIPLGGNRVPGLIKARNVIIVFVVSGLWHGAKWTFIAWGLLNAILYLPIMFFSLNKIHKSSIGAVRLFPNIKDFLLMVINFFVVVILWIFFRSETISDSIDYVGRVFSSSLISFPGVLSLSMMRTIYLITFFVVVEWFGRSKQHALEVTSAPSKYRIVRWIFYYLLILCIYFFGNFRDNIEFIYFQF